MKAHTLSAWSSSRRFSVHLLIANGLLLATAVLLFLFSRTSAREISLGEDLSSFPAQVGVWRKGTDQTLDPEIVDILGLEDWLERRYDNGPANSIWLYIGYMGAWETGKNRQAYHSPWFCYQANGWEITQHGLQPVAVPGEGEITVNRMLVERGRERQLLLYWVQQGDRIVTEGYDGGLRSKLSWMFQLPFLLLANERTDRALIKVTAPVIDTVEETQNRGISFIQAAFPALSHHFSLESGTTGFSQNY